MIESDRRKKSNNSNQQISTKELSGRHTGWRSGEANSDGEPVGGGGGGGEVDTCEESAVGLERTDGQAHIHPPISGRH